MNFLRDIYSSVWMVHPDLANRALPFVNNMLSGVSVDFSVFAAKGEVKGYSSSGKPTESKNILVIPIQGVIMKNDYCGDMGMMSLERLVQDATTDPFIHAIVLDIDSGGGQATYLDHVATALLEFRAVKPIVTHVSGMCASAAYYLAAQSNEIFVSSPLDLVGSIGTVMFMEKPNPNSTAATIPVAIYAPQSTAKNKGYNDVMQGKEETIKNETLFPYAQSFIDAVSNARPQVDETAFDGRAVLAADAQKLGLIDGIMRLDEVIQHTFSLIQ